MSNLPPLSSESKENLSHIISEKAAPPVKTDKIQTSAHESLKSSAPVAKALPEKAVQINEASLIKRWKEGGSWCKDESEHKEKLEKNPKLSFSIWSGIPTSWSVALSSGEVIRVSKGLTDPVGSARAQAIRANPELFVSESHVTEAKNAMLGLNKSSFLLRETSTKANPNEFTLEICHPKETKFSSYRVLCTESGYTITSTEKPASFTTLEALLNKLGVSRDDSAYNSLYDTLKTEFDWIGYQNVEYLKKLNPFVQSVALDLIQDTVQSKDTMKALVFRLTEE